MYFLIDCNNFFVSCERVFRPDLQNKPVAVLSNNDGCFVARSQEVKDVGIPMGAPYFKYEHIVNKYNITVFSSNFELYGDMSTRVMHILETFSPDIEIYSIDEAFLYCNNADFPRKTYKEIGEEIIIRVKQYTGIPVSVGIASTKTLCKVANEWGKRQRNFAAVTDFSGYSSSRLDAILQELSVGEIWGIGRNRTAFLQQKGVFTALDFKTANRSWVRKKVSVLGERTQLELQGIACFTLDTNPTSKKGIASTRSFGRAVTTLQGLKEAVSNYTSKAARKLRAQGSVAGMLTVFVRTSKHTQAPQYSNAAHMALPIPTDYNPELITAACTGVGSIFKKGYNYAKAGVYLSDLRPKDSLQMNLFANKQKVEEKRQARLMKVFDSINKKYGKEVLQYASQGTEKQWKVKKEKCSPRYTTRWEDVLQIPA